MTTAEPAPAAERVPTQVATPVETPAGLVEGLTRAPSADPAVKAAWLAFARWNDGDDGFLLDVRGDAAEVVIPVLMQRALEGVELDARLDVILGTPDKVSADAPGAGLELVKAR